MSLAIKTLSHGEIEPCGFTGRTTGLIRIGKYEIPTQQFAGFAAHVFSGGSEGWKEVPTYIKQAVDVITPSAREDLQKNIEYRLGKCRICTYEPSIANTVQIGDYKISTPEFTRLATYVLRGGFGGWKNETPWYVIKAAQEINKKIA